MNQGFSQLIEVERIRRHPTLLIGGMDCIIIIIIIIIIINFLSLSSPTAK
jgi:hypothetical protein